MLAQTYGMEARQGCGIAGEAERRGGDGVTDHFRTQWSFTFVKCAMRLSIFKISLG